MGQETHSLANGNPPARETGGDAPAAHVELGPGDFDRPVTIAEIKEDRSVLALPR